MKKKYFNQDISDESLKEMSICFSPTIKSYETNDTILRYSDDFAKVAIVLEGAAKLCYIDEYGESGLLEIYKKDDLFGDVFSLPIDNYEYLVTADCKCKIIFIDYKHVITPCEKACKHHSQLINNLFIMAAQKSQELALHINILNQRTTKKKLMAYLKYAASASIENCENPVPVDMDRSFEIPMTLGALSEYLCVDRSALMREIKSLNNDGIIKSERRRFQILG